MFKMTCCSITTITSLCFMLTGVSSQLSRTTSCVGEEIIYECTVNAVVHHWRIPSFDIETSVSRVNAASSLSGGRFNFTLSNSSSTTIITTMSVIAFNNLNGSEVICQDGITGNRVSQQNTVVMLFGHPSSPGLSVDVVSLERLQFVISPLSLPNQCILYYIINGSGGGTELPSIRIDDSADIDGAEFITMNASGFSLCNITYEFTSVAVTTSGLGMRSAVAIPQPSSFIDLPLRSDAVIGFSRAVYEFNLDDDNVIRIQVRMGDPELLFEVPVILDIAARSYNETFVFNSSQNFFDVSIPEQSADVPEPDELLMARLRFAGVPPLCVVIDPGAADIQFHSILDTTSEGVSVAIMTTSMTTSMSTVEQVTRNEVGILEVAGIATGVAVAGIFFAVTIMVAIAMILLKRSKKKKASVSYNLDKKAPRPILTSTSAVENPELSQVQVCKSLHMKNVPKHLVIGSCNLQLNESVGQGEFGIVYKGRLSAGFNKPFSTVVAVKTLKGFLEQNRVKDLLEECTKMVEFDHPNVLTLIGVCLDGGPAPFIVMPFMYNGSLVLYLKKERERLVIPPQQQLDTATAAVATKLINMGLQVAKGMEYLSRKRVVHRDLAARNCMIDINFVIKVADFGLSETIDPSREYFRQSDKNEVKLPVKWLAPESLNDGKFSEKSDVWAFGVTCWEIYTGGKIPYAGTHPSDLPLVIDRGYRLEKPDNAACIDEVYVLMYQCWANKPEDRSTFSEIVVQLSQLLESMNGYLELKA